MGPPNPWGVLVYPLEGYAPLHPMGGVFPTAFPLSGGICRARNPLQGVTSFFLHRIMQHYIVWRVYYTRFPSGVFLWVHQTPGGCCFSLSRGLRVITSSGGCLPTIFLLEDFVSHEIPWRVLAPFSSTGLYSSSCMSSRGCISHVLCSLWRNYCSIKPLEGIIYFTLLED